MNNRRGASRPYYRQSAGRDRAQSFMFAVCLAFVTGAMLGCAVAIGVMG